MLSRAGFAGWLTIMAFSTVAGLTGAIFAANSTLQEISKYVLELFELEVFLKPEFDSSLDSLATWLHERDGVIEVTMITRDDAAKRFNELYGTELFDLLHDNPLPSSILVRYNPSQMTRELFAQEAVFIGEKTEVDEVVFESELLGKYEKLARTVKQRFTYLGIIVLLVSVILTVQTVRVAGRANRQWAHAVGLIGGTSWDIRSPFLIAGALAGLIGGALGALVVYGLQFGISRTSPIVPPPDQVIFFSIAGVTTILGLVTAIMATPGNIDRIHSS